MCRRDQALIVGLPGTVAVCSQHADGLSHGHGDNYFRCLLAQFVWLVACCRYQGTFSPLYRAPCMEQSANQPGSRAEASRPGAVKGSWDDYKDVAVMLG